MADRPTEQPVPVGSGPLHEHGEAGRKAAEEPVNVHSKDDKEPHDGKRTGEEQAATNREVDPPA